MSACMIIVVSCPVISAYSMSVLTDHAEVHQRHREADGEGRERGHVEDFVAALRVDRTKDGED